MTNKWLKISSLLIFIGIVLVVVYWSVYLPKLAAYQQAINVWSTSGNHSIPPPSPQSFGLDGTTWIISSILRTVSGLLLFLGFGYFALYLIIRILRSLGDLR